MPRATLIVLAITLLATACASAGDRGRQVQMTFVSQDEIEASTAANAYDLVQQLRPRWLNIRGQQTLGTVTRQTATGPVQQMQSYGVIVYVDGTRVGEHDQLRGIPKRDLVSLQRLTATEATQRFGGGHPNGAVLVVTR